MSDNKWDQGPPDLDEVWRNFNKKLTNFLVVMALNPIFHLRASKNFFQIYYSYISNIVDFKWILYC